MKLYCLVENNMFVAGPVPILSPELSNLSDEELLSHGWRIAECIGRDSDVEQYDIEFDIQPNKVVCTFIIKHT